MSGPSNNTSNAASDKIKTEKIVFSGTLTINGHTIDATTSTSLVLETCFASLNRSMIMSSKVNESRACRVEKEDNRYYFKFLLPRQAEMKKILCLDYEPTVPSDVIEVRTKIMQIGKFDQVARIGDDIYLPNKVSSIKDFNFNICKIIDKKILEKNCTKMVSKFWDVYYFNIPSKSLGNDSGFQNPSSRTFFPFCIKWVHPQRPETPLYSYISYFADPPETSGEFPNGHELNVRNYVSNMLAGNLLGQHPITQYEINKDYKQVVVQNNSGDATNSIDMNKLFKKIGTPKEPKSIEMSPYNVLDPFPQYVYSPEMGIDMMENEENYSKVQALIKKKNLLVKEKLSEIFTKVKNDENMVDNFRYWPQIRKDQTEDFIEYTEDDILEGIIQSSGAFNEEPIYRKDYPIYLPVASTKKENDGKVKIMCFYPEQTSFTKTIIEHIHAISSVLSPVGTGARYFQILNEDTEDIFYSYRGNDYGFVKIYEGARKTNSDLFFKNRTISRLFGGSNSVSITIPGLSSFLNDVNSETANFSSFGFGCLNKVVIKFAHSHIVEKSSDDIWSLNNRNGVFNELIGITSQELDEHIFVNARDFYSNAGSNRPLSECIFNWFKTMFQGFRNQIVVDTFLRSLRETYANKMNMNFKNYIHELKTSFADVEKDDVFTDQDLQISASLEVFGEKIIKKERSHFVRILQKGPAFFGATRKSQSATWETSKIINMMDQVTKTTKSNIETDNTDPEFTPYLNPEGGTILSMHSKHDKKFVKGKSSEKFGLQTNKDYACPFGYIAKNLTRMSALVGNHLDYFLPGSHQYVNSSKDKNATLVKISTPDYINPPIIMMGTGRTIEERNQNFRITGPLSTEIVYYKDEDNIQSTTNSIRRNAVLDLSRLKEIWINYLKTPNFYNICIQAHSNNDIRERQERLFGINLAYFLCQGKLNTSIYNIIPQRIIFFTELINFIKTIIKKEPDSITKEQQIKNPNIIIYYYHTIDKKKLVLLKENTSKPENQKYEFNDETNLIITNMKRKILMTKFPTIYKNFIDNCDREYSFLRTIKLWECYLQYQNSKIVNQHPSILINGYLLSTDFDKKQNLDAHSLVTRFDYLALSASVYFEKNPPQSDDNYEKIFTRGLFSNDEKSRKNTGFLWDDYNNEFENKNTVIETVYANIADVPLFSCTKNGKSLFKTLNGCFSPSTSCMYYFARAIASSDKEYKHTFMPLSGVPYTITKLGLGEVNTENNSNFYASKNKFNATIADFLPKENKKSDGKGKRRYEQKIIPEKQNSEIDLGSVPSQAAKSSVWGGAKTEILQSKNTNNNSGHHDDYQNINLVELLAQEYNKKVDKEKKKYLDSIKDLEKEIVDLLKNNDGSNDAKIRELQADLATRQRPRDILRLAEKSQIISQISVLDRSFLESMEPRNDRRIEGASVAALLSSTYSHEGKNFKSDSGAHSAEEKAEERRRKFISQYIDLGK